MVAAMRLSGTSMGIGPWFQLECYQPALSLLCNLPLYPFLDVRGGLRDGPVSGVDDVDGRLTWDVTVTELAVPGEHRFEMRGAVAPRGACCQPAAKLVI